MAFYIRYRYLVSFSLWLALFMFYVVKANMTVAVLAMNAKRVNATQRMADCFANISQESKIKEDGPFQWTAVEQGTVLSAFFYGYLFSQFIGAVISTVIGPRYTLTICIFGSTLFTFLIIPMSFLGYEAVVVARILIGFFSGPLYPVTHETIGKWAPIEERTAYATITHSGNMFGLIINFIAGAFLCNYDVDGWKYFIYFSGGLGVLSFIFWVAFVYNNPWNHPFISEKEKNYIVNSIYPNGIQEEKNPIKKVPFKEMFRSKNVWIVCCCHFSYAFILNMFLTGFTKYLSDVYGLDVELSSIYSIIPFIVNFLLQIAVSFLANYIIAIKYKSVTFVRKFTTVVAVFGSCPLIIPVGFLNCDQLGGSIALLSISCGFMGLYIPGYFISMIDLSPKYSGYIMAITNTVGSIAGIFNPQIAGIFVGAYGTKEGWKYLFILTAIVSIITAMIWVIWGTCERRRWADAKIKYQPSANESTEKIIVEASKSSTTSK